MFNLAKITNPYKKAAQAIAEAASRDNHNCLVGKIVKYDKTHHLADVQPLVEDLSGDKMGIINNVTVPFSIYWLDEVWEHMADYLTPVCPKDGQGTMKITPPPKKLVKGTEVTLIIHDYCLDDYEVGKGYFGRDEDPREHDVSDAIIAAIN
ncbi:hypothetical protein FD17_GL000973 [Lentilactobacillus sunkii DSM 19904]|uniref:Uncharacterized protein n=1 Tax=Lentilactobacillus sunkii DSM 19904 TaxID=1423808 RepID=A0A0R1KVH5_9LACO|nr:hypothetical protein FD17_GL000973 [Lentilactobacillus sunkii DSM 19904]